MNVLATVKDLTDWPDRDLAGIVGLSRVTVNRVLRGHVPENLPAAGAAHLRDVLAEYAAELQKVITYLDMTS